MIGTNGNLSTSIDNETGQETIPEIRNIVPDGYDMTPVDMGDYQDYVDQANNNTENGDIGYEQGHELTDFVDPYFVDTENQPIIPENPNEVPTYP